MIVMDEVTNERRKRRKHIRRVLIITVLLVILLPAVMSVIVLLRLGDMERRLDDLEARLAAQEAAIEEMSLSAVREFQGRERIDSSIFYTASLEESNRQPMGRAGELNEATLPSDGAETNIAANIYLTFDDGPSSHTGKILDILAEYDVKATFFVIGRTDEQSLLTYRRIVDEGHTLGMHSYSHRYQEIYESVDAFAADLLRLQELLYETTGVWSRLYRFPGGSSNGVSRVDMGEFIDYLTAQDIVYFDWNVASGDAAIGGLGSRRIIDNCLTGLAGKSEGIILLHDTADKVSTVTALPSIIEGILADENRKILPITDTTAPVQHIIANR
ncbi:MAG: polysaccharide deacetylase family protein [Lachnospiraceae bacterium]|jgi:peptidoglycan/xylan/chitin deacetylase (PgdA/CDA1 family)/cell division protein FtsL|nr:polysaccharide deacetylase family protein [Lachnospiraceae bacterium]